MVVGVVPAGLPSIERDAPEGEEEMATGIFRDSSGIAANPSVGRAVARQRSAKSREESFCFMIVAVRKGMYGKGIGFQEPYCLRRRVSTSSRRFSAER